MKTDRRSVVCLIIGALPIIFSIIQIASTAVGFEWLPSAGGFYGELSSVLGNGVAVSITVLAGIGVVGTATGFLVFEEWRLGAAFGSVLALGLLSLSGFLLVRGTTVSSVSAAITALAIGGAVAFADRPKPRIDPSNETNSADLTTDNDSNTAADRVPPGEQIGPTVLDRLEPIAPDAVADARKREIGSSGTASSERVGQIERRLRQEIRDGLAADRLDLTVTSEDGEPYEIVNLPGEFREVTFPASGHNVHVRDVEKAVRELVESDAPLRDVAAAVAAVREHRKRVESHVRERERPVIERREDTEANLEAVREMMTRFDGEFGTKVNEIAIENRHPDLEGVFGIENRLETAKRTLHRCAFDDTQRELADAHQASETLLLTVDFLGGLVGTIDHGDGAVKIPEAVPETMVADICPLLERQYDVRTELEDDRIVVASRSDDTGDETVSIGTDTNAASVETAASDVTTSSATAGQTAQRSVDSGETSDEVLYILRELDRAADHSKNTIEYQTDDFPTIIARADALDELVTFCRRQTDIVATVAVQDGAPPGFLEIEFTSRTNAKTGIETLHNRFGDNTSS